MRKGRRVLRGAKSSDRIASTTTRPVDSTARHPGGYRQAFSSRQTLSNYTRSKSTLPKYSSLIVYMVFIGTSILLA